MTVNLVARATNCVWSKDHPKHQLKRRPSSNLNQKHRRKPIYSLPAIGGFAKKNKWMVRRWVFRNYRSKITNQQEQKNPSLNKEADSKFHRNEENPNFKNFALQIVDLTSPPDLSFSSSLLVDTQKPWKSVSPVIRRKQTDRIN
ncbi:hypothetical protein OIU79_022658 [Salix purpurea]|uniref:Uncharacterized protein n=1 Tax=Salix purpurea TaxID=77065 RepID=A0A9Q1AD18_SALPP|nr:hypothetical protein OIU79_022658 [Salix purpurea]